MSFPKSLGHSTHADALWQRRLQSGQAGDEHAQRARAVGHDASADAVCGLDRSNRRRGGAAGAAATAGPRANVVITAWDWADPKAYLHDQVSTDRRNPTVNANGLIYGALELSADYLPVLDPVRHTTSQVPLTVRDPNTPPTSTGDAGSRRRTGATSRVDEPNQRAQPDARRARARVDHVGGAGRRRIRTSARRARRIRPRSSFRSRRPAGISRSTIRRRRS